MRRIYAFFQGLVGDAIETTVNEYAVANVGWQVHSMGENSDGFWVLMERIYD